MNPALQLVRVGMQVGSFTMSGITFSLEKGDYFAVLGPSGCGKTTLLKILAGFCRNHTGTIAFNGVDATRLAPHKRAVGYMSQEASLFPHLDVKGNVEFGLRYSRISREESHSWMERIVQILGIRHLMERMPATLSGGESRRVALSRCLAISPRILLLDEPLAMLDPPARIELVEMLGRIHEELGMTTIHVTHDFDEALALAGQCAVMKAGRLEQFAPTQNLLTCPANDFVAEFVSASAKWRSRLQARQTHCAP